MVDIDLFRERMDAEISNHLMGIKEIFSLEECEEISERRDLNIVGIINALATEVISSSENLDVTSEDDEEELYREVVKFIEVFSTKTNKHPIDSTFYSIKMLSETLLQLLTLGQIEKEETKSNSEEE